MTDPLFALAAAGDTLALRAALPPRPHPDRILDAAGESLILHALFRGHTATALALAARPGGCGLHAAAALGLTARVAELAAAAPFALDLLAPDGWTALHLAAFFGHGGSVWALVEAGASARVMARAFLKNRAIHAACAGGRLDPDGLRALIAATGDPDLPDADGHTALMIAAANGFAPAVRQLLLAGASRAITKDGQTAADFARARGQAAIAAMLA